MKNEQHVQLGVIGLGNIAQQHIQHIGQERVSNCTISALCSRQPHPLADALGVPHFADYRELIDSGLCNAVLIATPTFSHAQIGAYALRAGLHLIMEKPIGISLQEGEQLLALQGEAQVFAVMLNQRTDPLFKLMHELIVQGRLGKISRCHWTMTNWFRPEVYFQVSDWRATWRGEGGGLLLNQCIHNLDILQWLCGMPTRVSAVCQFGKYHDIEVEDEATAYFDYANGASGVFIGSTGEAPGINRLDIIGDQGSLGFDGERLWLTTNTPSTSEYSLTTQDMFGMPETQTQDITPERTLNQHAAMLTNFSNAIVHGEELIAPAHEALHSLALANSILLSSWQSRPVELPLDSSSYQAELEELLADSELRETSDIDVTIDMSKSYR